MQVYAKAHSCYETPPTDKQQQGEVCVESSEKCRQEYVVERITSGAKNRLEDKSGAQSGSAVGSALDQMSGKDEHLLRASDQVELSQAPLTQYLKMEVLRPLRAFVCTSCKRTRLSGQLPLSRPLHTTVANRRADQVETALSTAMAGIRSSPRPSQPGLNYADQMGKEAPRGSDRFYNKEQPHRLHVYATKHNTHLTLTAPGAQKQDLDSKDPNAAFAPSEPYRIVLSMSAGNIGFRKAGRGSYDAAYHLAAFVLKQVQERGLLRQIQQLEVVLRGFGAGREAVTKAILGAEGRFIRTSITAVVDATRLKFGGTRSPKPRRLG